jgi:hypothetical protein
MCKRKIRRRDALKLVPTTGVGFVSVVSDVSVVFIVFSLPIGGWELVPAGRNELSPYRWGCWVKKRIISAEASGPFGSV